VQLKIRGFPARKPKPELHNFNQPTNATKELRDIGQVVATPLHTMPNFGTAKVPRTPRNTRTVQRAVPIEESDETFTA
jgi:hypothetical protein